MSFGSRIKAGFQLQEQSFAFIFKHPQLLIYWIAYWLVPTLYNAIARWYGHTVVEIDNPLFMSSPKHIAIIFIPITIITAVYTFHAYAVLTHQKITLSEFMRHVIATLPWVIMVPFIEFVWFFVRSLVMPTIVQTVIENASDLSLVPHYKVALWLVTGLISLLWYFLLSYMVIILVVERTNIFSALIKSLSIAKATWLELLTGKVCIQIVYMIIGGIFFIPAVFAKSYEFHPIVQGISDFIGSSEHLLMATLSLLIYVWYQQHIRKGHA